MRAVFEFALLVHDHDDIITSIPLEPIALAGTVTVTSVSSLVVLVLAVDAPD